MKKFPEFFFSISSTPKKSLIVVLVVFLLSIVTVKCGISEENFVKYYIEFRKFIKQYLPNSSINQLDDQLNQKINNDTKLLKQKIKINVDHALIEYETQERKYRKITMKNKNILEEINKEKYDKLQKLIVENAIYYEFADGTMGIRSSWVPPDPREIPLN